MKLALHIGTPKTGTTSLQRWFATNRDALVAQGVRYALTPGGENHRKLSIYARDTDKADPSYASFGIETLEDHERFRTELRKALAQEVKEFGHVGTWLMSNEHLYSKIISKPMVERLKALLEPHFKEITVYLHLRPQVDLLMSNTSQLARMGYRIDRAELTRPGVGPASHFYGYDKFLSTWESVFGVAAIRVVPFKRTPDMTRFMVAELGIDTADLTPMTRENTGLDWRAIALSNAVQQGVRASGLASAPEFYLDRLPGTERPQPGRALAQEIHSRFVDGNVALCERRKDITVEDLTPDWTKYQGEGNLHLIEAPCLFTDQIGEMVRCFSQALALETYRRHVAEGKVAALQGNERAVKRAQNAARAAAAQLTKLGAVVPAETGTTAA